MTSPNQVTACLVTRGDQPAQMERILGSLIFENVVVWDNSVYDDWKCAGRYQAAGLAHTEIVYFQDDDVLVPQSSQLALLEAYEPGVMVANWAHGNHPDGYEDLPLVGAGAVCDLLLPLEAISLYAACYPLDEAFKYEADFIVGVLYRRFEHVRLPFEINMEIAQHPSRLCNQPWQSDLKLRMTNRARIVRDLGSVVVA